MRRSPNSRTLKGFHLPLTRVVVLPVTSHVESLYPGEARIRLKGVPARGLGDQIRSIDKSRLRSRMAVLTRDELTDVKTALRITLGLGPT